MVVYSFYFKDFYSVKQRNFGMNWVLLPLLIELD